MSYPFVAAYWDAYGPRKGPTLGIGLHMAEGGGTVGYLDKIGTIPPRGVSVHAVCDRAGVVTQMLKWGDASGSLNTANRSTEKGYYGHSVLVAVLGDWWTDPNSAIVSMEIEGMAATGPNALQVPAVIAWGLDMRRMFTTIRGAFGHADQTDTKGCPGTTAAMKAIFAGIGGHGLFTTPTETSTVAPTGSTGDSMATTTITLFPKGPQTVAVGPGTLQGYKLDSGTGVMTNGAKQAFAAASGCLADAYVAISGRGTFVRVTNGVFAGQLLSGSAAPVVKFPNGDPLALPVAGTGITQADLAAAIAADRAKARITYG